MTLERPHYSHPLRKNLRIAALVVMVMGVTAVAISVPRALSNRAARLRATADLTTIQIPIRAARLRTTADLTPIQIMIRAGAAVLREGPMSVTEIAPGVVDCDVPFGRCMTSRQSRECAIRAGVLNMTPPGDSCYTHVHVNGNGDGR